MGARFCSFCDKLSDDPVCSHCGRITDPVTVDEMEDEIEGEPSNFENVPLNSFRERSFIV